MFRRGYPYSDGRGCVRPRKSINGRTRATFGRGHAIFHAGLSFLNQGFATELPEW